MSDAGQNRISVLRDNRMVPLLPSHAKTGRVQPPVQPWNGILLERHAVTPMEIPEHEHKDFCLHLQMTGQEGMEWWSNGHNGVERTAPGSMILLPAGTKDRLLWHGPSERLILSMNPELMAKIAEEAGGVAPEFEEMWSLRDASLERLLGEMGREMAEGWPLGRLYADLVVAGLASLLLRRHAADPVDLGQVRGGLPMPQLRRVMEYVTANLDRDLRLEEIAQEVSLSPFHFAREFRALTGQSPYQYLLDQRMDRAKSLLKNSAWTVQEVAQMTGFHSSVNFVRSFRQRLGVTPGAWRRDA